MLRAHLEEHAPFGAQLEFSDVDLGDPFLVDTSGWAVAEAKDAMTEAWGKKAVETGIGGSIPFIADLVTVFPDAQILVTGVEDPDSRAHSPNESLHLGRVPAGDPRPRPCCWPASTAAPNRPEQRVESTP